MGPLISALICLTGGYCHAWVCATGTDRQKTAMYLVLIMVMAACIMASLELGFVRGVTAVSRGQFIARVLLGGPIPVLAGIGLFAWCKPESWRKIADDRKMKAMKGD